MEDTNSASSAASGVASVSFQNIRLLETIFITAEGDVSLREAKTGLKDDHWGDFLQFTDKTIPIIWVRISKTLPDAIWTWTHLQRAARAANFRGSKFGSDKKLHSKLTCSSKCDIRFKDP